MTKNEMLNALINRYGFENETVIYFAGLMEKSTCYNDLQGEFNRLMTIGFWELVEEL